jgi:hypothetical protein
MRKEKENKYHEHVYKLVKKDGADETYFIDDIIIDKKRLRKGLEITWLADDTDFELWFPKDRHPFAGFIFLRTLPVSSCDRKIVRKLRTRLEPGTYYYSIFCNENRTMAEGNSSPKMIVRR